MIRSIITSLFFIGLISCGNNRVEEKSIDGQSQKIENTYAEHFSFEEFEYYSRLDIYDKKGLANSYALYKESEDLKHIPDDVQKIKVPVEEIASLSCVYTRAFYELGYLSAVKGVDQVKHHYLEDVNRLFEAGLLKELTDQNRLNIEKIFSLSPEVLFTYYSEDESEQYTKISKAGIPIVFCTSFLEKHPLGKAEWIKLFARFVGKEHQADSLFDGIVRDYSVLKESVDLKHLERKTVFCNAPFADQWYLPKNKSFTATFFKDAGLDYIWSDLEGEGNEAISLEIILEKALNADLWVNAGSFQRYEDLLNIDSRLVNFKAIKEEKVFNMYKRSRVNYGNDFWEMGSLHPDLILKDLISIAYPEILPDYETTFYKPLD